MRKYLLFLLFICTSVFAQQSIDLNDLKWLPNSHSFWVSKDNNVVVYDVDKLDKQNTILSKAQFDSAGFICKIVQFVFYD